MAEEHQHHHHQHHHGQTSEEHDRLNREFFDQKADFYEGSDWQRNMSAYIRASLNSRASWIDPRNTTDQSASNQPRRFLDYACGTGIVANALVPHYAQIVGMDLSPNMINAFNAKARAAGVSEDRMFAVVGNLLSDTIDEGLRKPQYFDFDLVAVGLGFHHFHDPALSLKRLAERLKPGGVILIVDFIADQSPEETQKSFPDAFHTIKTFGFNEQGMKAMFAEAGLEDFGFTVLEKKIEMRFKNKVEKTGFFARGRKSLQPSAA